MTHPLRPFRRAARPAIDCRGPGLPAPRILIVAASHGFPATKARLERPGELVRTLKAAGATCDVVLLCERALQPAEEDACEDLRSHAARVERLLHPALNSMLHQMYWGLRGALSIPTRLGCGQHAPVRLLSYLRSLQASHNYSSVIVIGAHLARVLSAFPRGTDRLIDIERVGFDAHRSHQRQGRGDVLEMFENPRAEIRLLELADAVIVAADTDAALLRDQGLSRDIVLAPPTGSVEPEAVEAALRQFKEPMRPPRLLVVGSETPANLDGVRWFRRQVLPRLLRTVPTCRLRLVGESARHIEPGPSIDRIGWVDRLDEEYRDAAMVILPLRMGSGVRRRAVEALAYQKALATTTPGAYGLSLSGQRAAIVSDDPDHLGAEIAQVLGSDQIRHGYESRAATLARQHYRREHAFVALLERLLLAAPASDVQSSSPRNSFMCVS